MLTFRTSLSPLLINPPFEGDRGKVKGVEQQQPPMVAGVLLDCEMTVPLSDRVTVTATFWTPKGSNLIMKDAFVRLNVWFAVPQKLMVKLDDPK